MAASDTRRVSVRMTPDEIWRFVADGHTGILTTLRRDGMPIALPVWYAVVDNRIYIRTRGKKLKRIAADPRSSFLVEAGERWRDLQAVHLTGTAHVTDPSPPLADRIRAEMDRKYAGYTTPAEAMPEATKNAYATAMFAMVEFVPEGRILHWNNSRLPIGE